MMRRERQQHPINQNHMFEIINHTLPIQKIHRRAQKIPIQRLGEAQAARAGGDVGDGDDFFEADDLDGGDDDEDVDVAGEHAAEEDADHDEGPGGAGDEGLFLLGVVVGFLLLLLGFFLLCAHTISTSVGCGGGWVGGIYLPILRLVLRRPLACPRIRPVVLRS